MTEEFDESWGTATRGVRAGTHRTPESEHSNAIYMTSSFVFDSAEECADRFAGNAPGNIYSRFTNPTVDAFCKRLAAMEGGVADFDGAVLLGCVIRGETSHYDIVANESARAVMELVVDAALPVGNGILTVENSDQAWVRADVKQKNKGGSAAQAALDMIAVRDQLGV